jgi:hypothetical protein
MMGQRHQLAGDPGPRCFIRKWAGRADGINCASNRCPDIQLIPAPSWLRIRAPVPHRRLDFYANSRSINCPAPGLVGALNSPMHSKKKSEAHLGHPVPRYA